MSPQSPAVEAIQLDSLAAWRICHGDAELLLAQQGAQILSYRRGSSAAADLAQRTGRLSVRAKRARWSAGVLALVWRSQA